MLTETELNTHNIFMKSFKKILVPTDFSENAVSAYTHAQEIAKQFNAKVDIIHVIPALKYFSESLSSLGVPLDNGDLYPTIQKETKHRLNDILNNYIQEDYKGQAITKIDRKAAHAITEIARTEGYDLIIMSTLGEHGSDLLRGTTTEKVIRHSNIPVFTVDRHFTPGAVKRILLPTDGSAISFSALPAALSMAHLYDAEITLFHVSELYGAGLGEDEESTVLTEEEKKYEAIISRLEDFLIDNDLDHIQVLRGEVNFEDRLSVSEENEEFKADLFTVIEKDVSAHHGIEEYAADHADMVVMATHGHSGFAHFFLGSTTEKVAQHIDLPVLTVKPDEKLLKKKEKKK